MNLVIVEWVDSHAGDGWQALDSLEAKPLHCRSVGWLVRRSETTTLLVSSISGERNGNLRLFGRGDIAIPNRAIRKVTKVRA